MATAQLNVRIDEQVKRAGDAVLERYGISATQAIRTIWQHMADHQRLPDAFSAMQSGENAIDDERKTAIDAGAGMALRMAKEAGIRAEFESMTYEQIRTTAYEEMLLEQEERHV